MTSRKPTAEAKLAQLRSDPAWCAVYGAAFVASFERGYAIPGVGFDCALDNNAEQAIAVADAAVKELEEYVGDGNFPGVLPRKGAKP